MRVVKIVAQVPVDNAPRCARTKGRGRPCGKKLELSSYAVYDNGERSLRTWECPKWVHGKRGPAEERLADGTIRLIQPIPDWL